MTDARRCSSYRSLVICSGLIAATIAAYWPVGSADFIAFDDRHYVFENEHVRDGLRWSSVGWALTTSEQANWHPLTWLSLMLDVQLFGVSSRAMHLVNLALHVGSTVVLFLALRRMTGAAWRSGMVAALFALHPLHVESVAWVAERKDVLSTFLGMLALWAYAGYAQQRTEGGTRSLRAAGLYALVFVSMALSLTAKPMLVTLPLVFLLLDYWPLRRADGEQWKVGRARGPGIVSQSTSYFFLVVEKLPLLALSAGSCWITLRTAQIGGAIKSMEQMALPQRLANAGAAYVSYIDKMFWPTDLSIFYPLSEPSNLAWGWAAWVFLAAVSVGAAIVARRGGSNSRTVHAPSRESHASPLLSYDGRYLAVGWFWYLTTLLPAIGLVKVGDQAMADRYTYVPLIGLFLAGVWGAADLASAWRHRRLLARRENKSRRMDFSPSWTRSNSARRRAEAHPPLRKFHAGVIVLSVVGGGILTVCAVLTADEARTWKNTETLFGQAIRVQPDNWHAHRILAHWLWRQGRYEEAMAGWQASLRCHPDDPDVLIDMAVAESEHGECEKAIASFREVLRLHPERVEARQLLAQRLTEKGETGLALKEWQAVLEKRPEDLAANNTVAWILAACPDARYRSGKGAVMFAEAAVQASGNGEAAVLDTLAAAYAEAGQFEKAVATAQRAAAQANAKGKTALEAAIRTRLESYEAGKPWRDPRLAR